MKMGKKNSRGFTIIEVMIVLAIAGLIIIIVLLAVPAVQRGARNQSRKEDVLRLVAGVQEFMSNNDSRIPDFCTPEGDSTEVTWKFHDTTSATSSTKVGYYTAGCYGWTKFSPDGGVDIYQSINLDAGNARPPLGNGDTNDKDFAIFVMRSKCTDDGGVKMAGNNNMAVQYRLETSSGYIGKCLDV